MNSPLEKWTKDMNGYFIDTDKEVHMAKKYTQYVQYRS